MKNSTKKLYMILILLLIIYIFFNNINIKVTDIKTEYLENTIIVKVYVEDIPLSINKRKKQFDKILDDLNTKYNDKYNYEIRFIQNKYNNYSGIFKYNGMNKYYGIKNFWGSWKGIKNDKIINKNGAQLIYFYENLNSFYPTIKVYVDNFSLSINNRKKDIDNIIKILYEDEKCKKIIDLMENEQRGKIIFIKLKNNFYKTGVTSLNYINDEFSEIGTYYKIGEVYFEENKKHYEIINLLGDIKNFIEQTN